MPGPLARLQLLTELSPQVVGPIDQSIWFSDGYGDFIRNTMHALAANASWAPAGESHILRSSSVVTPALRSGPSGRTCLGPKEIYLLLRIPLEIIYWTHRGNIRGGPNRARRSSPALCTGPARSIAMGRKVIFMHHCIFSIHNH